MDTQDRTSSVKTTNRAWQKHLRAKGIIPFFLDRLQQHALSSSWQYARGVFHFPIGDPELEDELSRAYFAFAEAFPYEFYLELTNHCNLSCAMCARPAMNRPMGVMSRKLYCKIIDEIAEMQPFAFIHYYGIGESTVDKTLFERLAYSRDKGLRNSLLFTNGQLLTHDSNYKKLADSELTNIGIDVDGFDQETYGKVRVGGDFAKVKRGVELLHRYIRERGLRVRVELAYQVVPRVNEHHLGKFVEWCVSNGYEYKIVTMHNWAGLRDDIEPSGLGANDDMHHAERTSPCPFLWNGFTIAWDGRVPVCFQDAALRETLGDLNRQTIEEIWHGTHRAKRRTQVAGSFQGLCNGCDSGSGIRLPPFQSTLYPPELRDAH